jgi:hypothetical protein
MKNICNNTNKKKYEKKFFIYKKIKVKNKYK